MIAICYTGCTSKVEIAELFAKDNHLHTQIRVYNNYKNYTSDLIQDLSIIILEYTNSDKLINICQNNQFNYWLFSVLKNNRNNKSSKQNKYYSSFKFDELLENDIKEEEQEEDLNIESVVEKTLQQIKKKNWYTHLIWQEYIAFRNICETNNEKFTYEKFGKYLKIDKDSLFAQVKKVKQILQNKLKNGN